MGELEILNYYQLAFIANAIYLLTFTGLIFITFRLVRVQRENNANTLGKILVTLFGLCTTFYGYNIFSYLRINQLTQSFRLSELESQGVAYHPLQKVLLPSLAIHLIRGYLHHSRPNLLRLFSY